MTNNFKDYGISNEITKALALLNFKEPTEVQAQAIPKLLKGQDTIVKSQTGSGKTATFAIPLCESVVWEENKPQALVLVPTRELAMQVKEEIFNIGRFKRIKTIALFGKSPFHIQQKQLKQKMHIVVGTPGRVLDHLQRGTLDSSCIQYLVLDEADEMLDMGFIKQIEDILALIPTSRTTMLFSATLSEEIEALCKDYMDQPTKIMIQNTNSVMNRIEQQQYHVHEEEKAILIDELAKVNNPDSCIVFCNTKQQVDQTYGMLEEKGYTCDRIHGGMEQGERTLVMKHFRQGDFRYLIATDVAARGIDIDDIALVINRDVPFEAANYVHRIGRTGRKDKNGLAITLVSDEEIELMQEVEALIEQKVPKKERPTSEEVKLGESAFIEKMKTKTVSKQAKGESLNREIVKLHINAGKKTKMRPVDVVGTICNIEGVEASDIGIINILDISTFVEILNNKGELVYDALQQRPIKGRMRKVSYVER